MNYKIINPVKPRLTASMFETNTQTELPIGYTFSSDVVTTNIEKINNINYTIDFIKLPNNYYVPRFLGYTNIIYVQEVVVSTSDPYKPKKVTVENDGGIYVGTDFTKI